MQFNVIGAAKNRLSARSPQRCWGQIYAAFNIIMPLILEVTPSHYTSLHIFLYRAFHALLWE